MRSRDIRRTRLLPSAAGCWNGSWTLAMLSPGTRIYIAGCGGMLGEAFHDVLAEKHVLRCTDIDVNADWLSFLDFRDFEAYRRDVAEFRPDFLFHLGAH